MSDISKDISNVVSNSNSYTNNGLLDAQLTSRQYKDSLLRAIFKDAKRLIELYNAIAGEDYPEGIGAELCKINPVMAMFNDLAF